MCDWYDTLILDQKILFFYLMSKFIKANFFSNYFKKKNTSNLVQFFEQDRHMLGGHLCLICSQGGRKNPRRLVRGRSVPWLPGSHWWVSYMGTSRQTCHSIVLYLRESAGRTSQTQSIKQFFSLALINPWCILYLLGHIPGLPSR